MVQAADHYINENGLSTPPYNARPAEAFEDCYRKTGLGDCVLKVSETFKTEFEAIRAFF